MFLGLQVILIFILVTAIDSEPVSVWKLTDSRGTQNIIYQTLTGKIVTPVCRLCLEEDSLNWCFEESLKHWIYSQHKQKDQLRLGLFVILPFVCIT